MPTVLRIVYGDKYVFVSAEGPAIPEGNSVVRIAYSSRDVQKPYPLRFIEWMARDDNRNRDINTADVKRAVRTTESASELIAVNHTAIQNFIRLGVMVGNRSWCKLSVDEVVYEDPEGNNKRQANKPRRTR